jgi:hypothetical protein
MVQKTNQLECEVLQRECRQGRAGDLSGARQLNEFQTAAIVSGLRLTARSEEELKRP